MVKRGVWGEGVTCRITRGVVERRLLLRGESRGSCGAEPEVGSAGDAVSVPKLERWLWLCPAGNGQFAIASLSSCLPEGASLEEALSSAEGDACWPGLPRLGAGAEAPSGAC